MNAVKLRRFHALVFLQCVRWYSKYTISYRQIEGMMAEAASRWIQRYADTCKTNPLLTSAI